MDAEQHEQALARGLQLVQALPEALQARVFGFAVRKQHGRSLPSSRRR